MRRALSVCAVVLVLPIPGWADPPPQPTERVVRMTIQPMAAPRPALKFQLLPELGEMNPGNPAQGYAMCFPEQSNFWHNKDNVANREKWATMPLQDLAMKDLRYFGYGPLTRADDAARLTTIDWQVLHRARKEGIGMHIPEVHQLGELAFALKVRFRVEIAERRFDDALVTVKTMLALGRHMSVYPTINTELVSMAIVLLAFDPLEEMLQQPGCPNLFWALTDLPSPLIDLHRDCRANGSSWPSSSAPSTKANPRPKLSFRKH